MLTSILGVAFSVTWWILVLVLMGWLIKELTMGISLSQKRLDGRVVVITGGTSGIGYQTVLEMAKRGATVIFGSIDNQSGKAIEDNLRKLSGNDNVHFKFLDLSSQKDTKRFAHEIKEAYPTIDFLINNAGIGGDHRFNTTTATKTKDGFELIMATNFLGHFTLTEMLLENIKAAAGKSGLKGRVVHVASVAHVLSELDITNPDFNRDRQEFKGYYCYTDSKLATIWYSDDLARRLEGSNVESVSLHPGVVRTNIFNEVNDKGKQWFIYIVTNLLGKNSWQGAQTTIEAVLCEDNLNGKYLSDCRDTWMVSSKRDVSADDKANFRDNVMKALKLTVK